jgi:hypothetical protein
MSLSKKPLKRHPTLKDLSRDHQKMLKQARAIRWVASSDQRADPLPEVLTGLQQLWTAEIQLHFREEEEVLIPFCLGHDGTFQPLARQIGNDHTWLRDSYPRLVSNEVGLLATFGRNLHDHVRFEERVVYNHIQDMLSPHDLSALGVKLRQFRIQYRLPNLRRGKR